MPDTASHLLHFPPYMALPRDLVGSSPVAVAMAALLSPLGATLTGGGFVVVLYFLYRAALPRPLADVPYNKDAASKLFGDVPEMMGYVMRTKRIFVCVSPAAAFLG